jgi:hypothetical protein
MRLETIFLLCAFPLGAQTARIEGVITNAITGAPVPRAHVTLEGSIDGQRGRYGTTSATDGRFSITGITPGSFMPMAERVGFVRSLSVRAIDWVTLKADDSKTGIEIRLTPTGTITGRVTNSDGEPLEGAFVIAESGHNGVNATADEKGQYRIGGLAPGKYRLKASLGDMIDGRPEIRTDGTEEVHNAATYYPGKVAVLAGQESPGMDIQLARVPFVRVSGKVVGIPPGAEEASIMVWQGSGGTGTQIKPDGSFELWRLDPGKYRLSAEWSTSNGAHAETAGTEIEVAGSNIDKIELRVIGDSQIAGQLEFEDDPARQSMPQSGIERKVVLASADGSPMMNEPVGVVVEDGSFRFEKVSAGRYKVRLSWDSAYVSSMRLGSKAIEGSLLDLSDGSGGADLSVVLSVNMGSIAGTAPVGDALVKLTNGDRGWQTPAQADGTYHFAGLVPGSYRIGFDDNDEDALETVEIKPGEKVTKDLKRQ